MDILDHWHPVVKSKSLRRQPVGVLLAGREFALFRTRSGQVGALDDICPHRRMRLSLGKVVGEHLQCRYHGWTFDCAGHGTSPGTPKMEACASSVDAQESHGYIWIRSKRSTTALPRLDVDGWVPMATTEHTAPAPLELVLDNFTEVEHTPMTHKLFGYRLDRMHEVKVRYETTDDTVKVINEGPAKQIGMGMRILLGIGRNYLFNDVWTTYFSPVYSVFDHFWTDPVTGKEGWVKWRAYVFLTPLDDKRTRIISFVYAKSKWPVPPHGGLLAFRGFTRHQANKEILRDVELVGGLASKETDINGMKLSRFDRTLGLNRERIARIYRGQPTRHDLKIASVE